MTTGGGALPTVVVIGAMKCGTTALHRHLARHPDVAMSDRKELNFFIGADRVPEGRAARWVDGNWHRGVGWYAAHFPASAPVRGESSPGYTSPDHPEVASRMAATIPHARLVYLVRDPIARAVSQYRHHRRDGTEVRPLAAALLDPDSQYVARSRYHERLAPFLARFPPERILVVAQEALRDEPFATLRQVHRFLGVVHRSASDAPSAPASRPTDRASPLPDQVRDGLVSALHDDAVRLRALTGLTLASWSV